MSGAPPLLRSIRDVLERDNVTFAELAGLDGFAGDFQIMANNNRLANVVNLGRDEPGSDREEHSAIQKTALGTDGVTEEGGRCMTKTAPEQTTEQCETQFRAPTKADRDTLARVRRLVAEQAEDEGLWFIAEHAPEAYLQQELRRLHRVIEGKE
jgi:hypothetical protein